MWVNELLAFNQGHEHPNLTGDRTGEVLGQGWVPIRSPAPRGPLGPRFPLDASHAISPQRWSWGLCRLWACRAA